MRKPPIDAKALEKLIEAQLNKSRGVMTKAYDIATKLGDRHDNHINKESYEYKDELLNVELCHSDFGEDSETRLSIADVKTARILLAAVDFDDYRHTRMVKIDRDIKTWHLHHYGPGEWIVHLNKVTGLLEPALDIHKKYAQALNLPTPKIIGDLKRTIRDIIPDATEKIDYLLDLAEENNIARSTKSRKISFNELQVLYTTEKAKINTIKAQYKGELVLQASRTTAKSSFKDMALVVDSYYVDAYKKGHWENHQLTPVIKPTDAKPEIIAYARHIGIQKI
jgi:hypothetical protein